MELLAHAFRLLAASQVALFFLVILFSDNPSRVRVIGCALLFAIFCYFLVPPIVMFTDIRDLVVPDILRSMVPTLTLLFVWVVFEEQQAIPPWMMLIALLDLSLSVSIELSLFVGGDPDYLPMVSQLLKVLSASIAIYLTWRGRENDLVELRLKARRILVGALSLTVLAVAMLEIGDVLDIRLPGEPLGMAWMFVLALAINYAFIKINPDAYIVGEPVAIAMPEDIDDPEVANILDRMRTERLYADHDLRVGTLADIIGLPEYQLRKKINQNLGFRNFNQFVNRYRIEEAATRLLVEPRMPVLSIALDVGFRSISSFNTAFQAHFGVSATAYRSKRITDS